MNTTSLVELLHIEKNFGESKVLENFNMKINRGEILCILGPSGCGKSTLLNIISDVIKIDKGKVINNSFNTSYVFQEDRLLPWRNVFENIHLVNTNDSYKYCMELIEKVGLKGFEDFYPSELSGGMRQRCSIARAFNYNADLLLMDEPFKSLDYNLRIDMINHLIRLWEDTKKTIVFVTHEIDEALLLGDRIILLSSRPAKIQMEFDLDKEKLKRKLIDSDLMKTRAEIVEIMERK